MSEMRKGYTISRCRFMPDAAIASSLAVSASLTGPVHAGAQPKPLRLGGPILDKVADHGQWVLALKKLGYSAASFPLTHFYDSEDRRFVHQGMCRCRRQGGHHDIGNRGVLSHVSQRTGSVHTVH